MKWFGLLLACCMLCSCGTSSGTHESVDAVHTSIAALEQSLPKECKTAAISKQIESINQQICSVEAHCEKDKALIQADKVKWQTAFFGLLFMIAFYFFVFKRYIK